MRPRLLLTILAFLGFIGLGLPDGLLGVAWPSMRATFGVPLDALGILLAVSTSGYLVSSGSSGRLIDGIGLGTLLALSAAATALSLLGFGLAPAWWVIIGLSFLAGSGAGAIDAGLNAFVATHFSARTLNWLHACFGVGITLGPLIMTGVLTAELVWRWGYLVVGSAQALLALTFLLTRRRWDVPRDTGGSPEVQPPKPKARETVRAPGALLGVAVFFVYVGVEITAGQWTYTVLTQARGVPEATAGLLVSLYWGSLMTGRILFGLIADRAPIDNMLRLCMVTAVVASLLFWLDLGSSMTAAALLMAGLSLAPIFPSLIATTPARLGAGHAAAAIGFQIAAAGLGGALLPGLVGVLARSIGLEVVGAALFTLSLLLLALFQALAAAHSAAPVPGANSTAGWHR